MLIKKGYALTVLFLFALNCTGCVGGKTGLTDKQRIEKIRENNSKTEIRFNTENLTEPTDIQEQTPVPISKPLTMDEAVSYALTYNLDAEVKQLERDILKESLAGARLKMLPSLTLDGEISRRDSYDASYSDPLFTEGEQDYNYSRDKSTKRFNLELSWDILNFGIAYYQQRQAEEQYRIAEQRRRRVVQNLKFDVTKTYWQALAAKRAMVISKDLVERLQERESILKNQRESLIKSEIETLETSVIMSEMQMNMSGFENEYYRYKAKLAVLMGLPKGSEFELADGDFETLLTDAGNLDMSTLELEALHQRPELYEQDMEESISLDDARIAVARTMPKPSLFYRYNYDGDKHLYEDQWYEVGVRLSFDLLAVPQQLSHKREANIKTKLVKKRRQSVAAAILTQLRLAVIDFNDANRKYRYSDIISKKRKQLVEAHKRHAEFGDDTYETIIENEAKYLISEVRRLQSQVDLKVAEQRILNSIGSEDVGVARFLSENQDQAENPDIDETLLVNEPGFDESADKGVGLSEPEPEETSIEEIIASESQLEEQGMHEEATDESLSDEPSMEVVFSESDLSESPSTNGMPIDSDIVEEPIVAVEAVNESGGMNTGIVYGDKGDAIDYDGLGRPLPYTIQLASSRTKKDAMMKLSVYKKKGLKAYLVQINLKASGLWWRCYEGSYATPEEASQAKADYGYPDAIVMETPYAVCLGNFQTKSEMNDLISKVISLGYSPYIITGEGGTYQLMVGAFYSMEKTSGLVDAFQSHGMAAQGVRR